MSFQLGGFGGGGEPAVFERTLIAEQRLPLAFIPDDTGFGVGDVGVASGHGTEFSTVPACVLDPTPLPAAVLMAARIRSKAPKLEFFGPPPPGLDDRWPPHPRWNAV